MADPDFQRIATAVETPGLIGLIVGVVGGVIQQRYGSWFAWARGVLAAVTVAILLGLWLRESTVPFFMQCGLIGVCAFVATDILDSFGQLANMLKTDPFGFVAKVREAIRGNKGGN